MRLFLVLAAVSLAAACGPTPCNPSGACPGSAVCESVQGKSPMCFNPSSSWYVATGSVRAAGVVAPPAYLRSP